MCKGKTGVRGGKAKSKVQLFQHVVRIKKVPLTVRPQGKNLTFSYSNLTCIGKRGRPHDTRLSRRFNEVPYHSYLFSDPPTAPESFLPRACACAR